MSLPLIDVHTHMYLPRYVALLRARQKVPRIVSRAGGDRLVILPDEETDTSTSAGRPIGGEFHEVSRKLAFMDHHGIAVSVVSSANPWIDFVEPDEAPPGGRAQRRSRGDLRGLGRSIAGLRRAGAAAAGDLRRGAATHRGHPHMQGVIIGSAGRGHGLDDPDFEPIWKAAADAGLFVFIHPHYGIGHGLFPDTGHAMMLALGFTFETSIAVSLLILRGVLARHPALKLLIAHAGGTLPYLAGRLDSCVKNDISKDFGLPKPPSHYLRQCWYDSIAYHGPALAALEAFADPAKIMFGTDHPFFARMWATPCSTTRPGRRRRRTCRRCRRSTPHGRRRSPTQNGLAAFGIALPRITAPALASASVTGHA